MEGKRGERRVLMRMGRSGEGKGRRERKGRWTKVFKQGRGNAKVKQEAAGGEGSCVRTTYFRVLFVISSPPSARQGDEWR